MDDDCPLHGLVEVTLDHRSFVEPEIVAGKAVPLLPATVEVRQNGIENVLVEGFHRDDGVVVISLKEQRPRVIFETTPQEEHAVLVEALLARAGLDIEAANAVANEVAQGLDRIMASREGLEDAPPLFMRQWWHPTIVG